MMIWHVSPLREYRGHGPLKNIPVDERAAISSSLCTNSPTETLFLLLPFFSVYLLLDSARISLYTSKSRGEGGENRRGVIVIRDIQTYFRKLNRISRSET